MTTDLSSQSDVTAAISSCEKSCRWGARLLSLLAIGAFGLSIWNFMQVLQYRQARQSDAATFQQMLSEHQGQIEAQQASLTDLEETIKQALAQSQQISSDANHIAEATQLAEFASYYLQILHDPVTAKKMLTASQSQIDALTGTPASQARQKVVNAITLLEAVPVLDLGKLIQSLDALDPLLEQLPLATPDVKEALSNKQVEPQGGMQASGWRSHLSESLDQLSKLVIVRNTTGGVTAELLPPSQQFYLVQNLRMYLQHAAWAAMNGQASLYQQSLDQVITGIKAHFLLQSSVSEALLSQLSALKQASVAPPLPDISQAVFALKALGKTSTYSLIVAASPEKVSTPKVKSS